MHVSRSAIGAIGQYDVHRTRRENNDRVHLCPEHEMVTGLGGRGLDLQPAILRDHDLLEDVPGTWDFWGCEFEFSECRLQIVNAVLMVALMPEQVVPFGITG